MYSQGVLQISSVRDDGMGAKIKTKKNPYGFHWKLPQKWQDQKLTPTKSHAEWTSHFKSTSHKLKNSLQQKGNAVTIKPGNKHDGWEINWIIWSLVGYTPGHFADYCIDGIMKQMQCNARNTIIINHHKTSLVVLCLQNYAAGTHGHYHESSDCFDYPESSLLKSSHPKKSLTNFPTQKNPRIENFKLQKMLWLFPTLEIQSTPPPQSRIAITIKDY